jgi:hypothetical protein
MNTSSCGKSLVPQVAVPLADIQLLAKISFSGFLGVSDLWLSSRNLKTGALSPFKT